MIAWSATNNNLTIPYQDPLNHLTTHAANINSFNLRYGHWLLVPQDATITATYQIPSPTRQVDTLAL